MKLTTIFTLTIIVALLATGATAEERYTITQLNTLGGSESWPSSINNLGQVVGISQVDYSHITRPFFWDNGIITDLNDLLPSGSGWELIHAEGINDAGYIVGKGSFAGGVTRAFLMTPNGGGYDIVQLNTLGGSESWPSSINSLGQVVGISQVDYSHITRPFIWDNGIITDLNDFLPPGSDWELIHAEGINDAGFIIGKGFLTDVGTRAFLLSPIPEPSLGILLVGMLGMYRLKQSK